MSSSNYASREQLKDTRMFSFGSIWKINDFDVHIPQVDKVGSKRTRHSERWVVVISNNNENFHPLCPIVTVAPLSSRVDLKKQHDLELNTSDDNVAVNCLLQLKLMQPILKVDLYDNKGEISEEAKVETQVLLEDFFGLSFEEED